jgi:ABC-type multidrug transport system permease subunit
MKHNVASTVASLLSIHFMTFHHTDDIVRGMAPGGIINLVVVLILIVWLYATLMLEERRAGYIIILVASLFASAMPVVHMTGAGLAGGKIADSNGAFFFVWTLIALGVTAPFSAVLSAGGLWRLHKGQKKQLSPQQRAS